MGKKCESVGSGRADACVRNVYVYMCVFVVSVCVCVWTCVYMCVCTCVVGVWQMCVGILAYVNMYGAHAEARAGH